MRDPSSTTARGRAAEARVALYLEQHGYVVVARNVRVGRDEIDVVAYDGATLVCVEVRSSRAGAMVHPLESLTAPKRLRMRRAAMRHAASLGLRDVRIDVVAVVDGVIDHHVGAIDFSES